MVIYDQVRETALPNYLEAKIPVPSALNIPRWREMLTDYHDTNLVDLLELGWPADYTAQKPPTAIYTNHARDGEQLIAIDNNI